jgi:DNA-binding NtrC family response regulator
MICLLAIDDDPQSLAFIEAALEQEGLEIVTAEDAAQGLEIARRRRPDIVLVDLMMPGMSGMEVLERIQAMDPSIEVLLMTAHYSTESAVEAIQKGACDYLNKPIPPERLQQRIAGLLDEIRARGRARDLEEELLGASRFHGIVGRSPQMLEVFARIRRVAPHYRTALLTGATGTGKELAARALHELSPAAKGPFVVCNCAAIPESLAESELFGHLRGAFTGAAQDKTGLFEFAHGGTLFLDEVGEMQPPAQAKLLRAVQNQEVQKVGSPSARKVNVRIVAATNRDLRASVAAREFREDLFFRLAMVEIRLPALAERKEDVPLLLRHFTEHFARLYGKPLLGISRRAEVLLCRYPWPGNVREVENAIGYAAMMTQSGRIDIHDLPESLQPGSAPENGVEFPLVSLEQMQRIHARRVVEHLGGDKIEAAKTLGVSRATLYRLLGTRQKAV